MKGPLARQRPEIWCIAAGSLRGLFPSLVECAELDLAHAAAVSTALAELDGARLFHHYYRVSGFAAPAIFFLAKLDSAALLTLDLHPC